MGFCVIKPSKHQLWDEIEAVVGKENRELIKYWYNVAHDSRFLEASANEIVLNEEGEPTFSSLLKVANTTEYNEKIKETLNNQIGAGEMTYKEACEKLFNFNKNSNYNDRYLATIQRTEGGKVRLFITEKTDKTTKDLYKQLKSGTLAEKLQAKLNQHGVTYEFVDHSQFEGRYSTLESDKVVNGLQALIAIRDGKNVGGVLAEEAGHFVIGSLGESRLVQRLEQLLNSDVINRIFGDELENKNLGAQPRRETAGYLVGQALINKLSSNTVWDKLANRIAYVAKRIFAKITFNEVLALKTEALNSANKIAESFLNDEDFEGTVEQALEAKETFYDIEKHAVAQAFEGVRNSLMGLSDLLSTYDAEAAEAIKSIVVQGSKDYSNIDMIMRQQAVNGLFTLIEGLIGQVEPIRKNLSVVKAHMENSTDYWNNFTQDGQTIRQYRDTVKAILECMAILENFIGDRNKKSEYKERVAYDEEGNKYTQQLSTLYDNLAALVGYSTAKENSKINLERYIHGIARDYYCKFLEGLYGKDYIHMAQQRIFKGAKQVVVPEQDVKISQLLEAISEDGTYFGQWIGAMYNSSDVLNQIVYKAYKAAETQAAIKTIQLHDQLRALKKRADSIGMRNNEFYEKDEQGHYTGNFLDIYDYGKYEREYQAMKLEFQKKFKEKYKDYYDERDLAIKFSVDFASVRREFLKKTHYHKELPGGKQIWILKDEYINKAYLEKFGYTKELDYNALYTKIISKGYEGELSKKEQLLFEIKQLKREIDKNLPSGSTVSYRAPQFKTSLFHRMGNAFIGNGNVFKKGGKAVLAGLNACGAAFVMNATEGDFGSDMHATDSDVQIVKNPYYDDYMKLDRLPIYGVKKVKNYTQFSTDIWNGLAMYGNMAYKYNAKEKIIHALEIGRGVLKKRKIGGFTQSIIDGAKLIMRRDANYDKEKINPKLDYLVQERNTGTGIKNEDLEEHMQTPRFYKRFASFLDRQVYQHPFLTRTVVKDTKVFKSKIWNTLFGGGTKTIQNALHSVNKITGIAALGGNLAVAAVSLSDGLVEIAKEAGAHENFTQIDLLEALGIFSTMNISNTAASVGLSIPLLNVPSSTKFNSTQLHLLNRFWEISTSAEEEAKKWNTQNIPSVDTLIMKSLYAGMAVGNFAMNMIPAIAMLRNNFIYDVNGDKLSLFKWTTKKASYKVGDSVNTINMTDEPYFRNQQDADNYNKVNDLKSEITDYLKSDLTESKDFIVSDDQLALIREHSGDFLRKLDIQESSIRGKYTVNLTRKQAEDLLKHTNFTMEQLKWGVNDIAQFKTYMRSVLNNMHGMYDADSANAFQQTVLGSLWAHMKGYVFGLVHRRFTDSSFNIYEKSEDGFGGVVEGSLVTSFKGITSFITSPRTFFKFIGATILGMLDVYGGGYISSLLYKIHATDKNYLQELGTNMLIKEGFCKKAYSNIKRTIGDYTVAVILNSIIGCLQQPPEDDPYYDLTYSNPWNFLNNDVIKNKRLKAAIKEAREAYDENRLPNFKGISGKKFVRITDFLFTEVKDSLHPEKRTLCSEKTLLERFGTKQNVERLKKIRSNEMRGINKYYDDRPIDTRACLKYLLGRVANDNKAFNDIFVWFDKTSPTRREFKGLENVGSGMIAPAMILQIGDIIGTSLQTFDWIGDQRHWRDQVQIFEQHLDNHINSFKKNKPSKQTVIENLISDLTDNPSKVYNSIFKDDLEVLQYMLENRIFKLDGLNDLYGDVFYTKSEQPYKKYDAKLTKKLIKIAPFLRSIYTMYNASDAYDSYMFATLR